jgi:hypothetical protein
MRGEPGGSDDLLANLYEIKGFARDPPGSAIVNVFLEKL